MLVRNQQQPKIERLEFIDKACGIAILLVVYGHVWFPETIDIDWYYTSQKFVYKFHMPLFMCLSGYLAFLSTDKKNIDSTSAFFSFQKKKLRKFLPAYIFFSLLSILIDIFYHHASDKEINTAIFNFFFIPASGSAVFVWYLYVLFGFYFITPFLLKLKSQAQYLLLFFGFLLTNIAISPLFSADLFGKYFFFFFSGGLIYKYKDHFISFVKTYGHFIVILAISLSVFDLNFQLILPYQALCIVMIFAIFYISSMDWPRPFSEIFTTIGISSFGIFLLNTTILNLYYMLYKVLSDIPIGGIFIFSGLFISVTASILLRALFNKVVPHNIYAL